MPNAWRWAIEPNSYEGKGLIMLAMREVSKVFRTDLIETHALRRMALDVQAGEFVAVTGPSGSGKTTFLNVAGLLEPFDTGTYQLDGQDVAQLSDDARSRLRNEKIGFIFQNFNLMPDLSVYDNVDVPLRYRRMKSAERDQRIRSALDVVGLAARAKHVPAQLSGGQQQRVAIARAIAGDPKLLLADEPTGNLDSLMARQVMDLLEQINEMGTTIIMVTHDPELARRAQRNIQVVDGQVSDFKPYEPTAASMGIAPPADVRTTPGVAI
jgi:putative ABC transport system ATP-binding protein